MSVGYFQLAYFVPTLIPTIATGDSLGAALQGYYATCANLKALTSTPQLWHIEADLGIPLPWAAYFVASAPRELTTNPYITTYTVQWSFAAATAAGATALAQAFMQQAPDGFDRAVFTINGTPIMSLQFQDDGQVTIGEGKGPGGKDCYLHVAFCEVMTATVRS